MILSEQSILQLLIDKGVEPSYIQSLKKRKVLCMNKKFYDTSEKEETLFSQEFIDIPVSKIISTHRISGTLKSWWANIFSARYISITPSSWEGIEEIFRNSTLAEFRKSLFNDAPPLEKVYYYPKYDVYEVIEGHHRTVWAILTNTPFLKVRRNNFITCEYSQVNYEIRKSVLNEKSKLRKNIRRLDISVDQLIKKMNLNYDGEFLSFKDVKISWLKKEKLKDLFEYDLFDDAHNYISDLIYTQQRLTELFSFHQKLKYLPARVRTIITKLLYWFSPEDHFELLNKLYDKYWKPSVLIEQENTIRRELNIDCSVSVFYGEDALGRIDLHENEKIHKFAHLLRNGANGVYFPNENEIYIKSDSINSIGTLAHELRHAYQYEHMKKSFKFPDDFYEYDCQYERRRTELDANTYAKNYLTRLIVEGEQNLFVIKLFCLKESYSTKIKKINKARDKFSKDYPGFYQP